MNRSSFLRVAMAFTRQVLLEGTRRWVWEISVGKDSNGVANKYPFGRVTIWEISAGNDSKVITRLGKKRKTITPTDCTPKLCIHLTLYTMHKSHTDQRSKSSTSYYSCRYDNVQYLWGTDPTHRKHVVACVFVHHAGQSYWRPPTRQRDLVHANHIDQGCTYY